MLVTDMFSVIAVSMEDLDALDKPELDILENKDDMASVLGERVVELDMLTELTVVIVDDLIDKMLESAEFTKELDIFK